MIPTYDEVGEQDEVLAFDASTLELRLRFGGGKFKREAYGMAVVGEELYVGDRTAWSLHVFSLAGEHLRELFGEWREPNQLLHVDGRLYLTEQLREIDEDEVWEQEDDEDEWPYARREAGRRIFVLTPEGQTLQVWKMPEQNEVRSMVIFRNELLVDTLMDDIHNEIVTTQLLSLAGI